MSRKNSRTGEGADPSEQRPRSNKSKNKIVNTFVPILVAAAMVFTVFGGISFASSEAEAASGWDGQPSTMYSGTQAFRTENSDNPGSISNPFYIDTAGDLKLLQEIINNDTSPAKYNTPAVYYVMTADIILNDLSLSNVWSDGLSPKNKWIPIGTGAGSPANTFAANFDGDHFAVKGIYVNKTTDYTGLFGRITGKIQNLGVEQSYFKGDQGVGGIAGSLSSGSITNCYNTGTVTGSSNNVGGISGAVGSGGNITKCHNTGMVTSSGHGGGITGLVSSDSNVTDCYNTGTVTGTYVGGIAGTLITYSSSGVTNCYNTGTITGYNVGGIVASISSGSLKNCYNAGAVTGTSSFGYTGGIVGDGYAVNCYNTGTVTSPGKVGGIAGNAAGGIIYCYFLKVSGTLGISGQGSGTVTSSGTFGTDGLVSGNTLQSLLDFYALNKGLGRWAGTPFPYLVSLGDTENSGGIWGGNVATGFAGGNGSAGSPYKISNGAQLAYLRQQVNNNVSGYNTSSVYYVLTNDIYLNDMSNWNNWGTADPKNKWTPIGTGTGSPANAFAANFDGNGFAVRGVYINVTTNYAGLFGRVTGNVHDLGVEQSYIKGYERIGGIAGYNGGNITKCYSTATVTGSAIGAGGIAGYNAGGITNCYNLGEVTGSQSAGGIAGYSDGSVTNCYNTVAVKGSNNIGGIAGYSNGSITNCYNIGAVTSSGSYVGGIAGTLYGSITNCYNTGAVAGSGTYIAGIAGVNNGSVSYCYCPSTMDFIGDPGTGTAGVMLKFNTNGTFASSGSVTVTGVGTATNAVDALNYWACSSNSADGSDRYLYFESTGATSGMMFRLTESGFYKVKFDLNALSGTTPADQNKKFGEKLTAPADPSVSGGAVFLGWYTKNGAGGDWGENWDFADGIVQSTMTLYARSGPSLFTVTYDLNGGSGTAPASSNIAPGKMFSIMTAKGIIAPTGKQFKEWNNRADGTGTKYTPGTKIMMPAENLVLYAIWENITFTLRYNGNGGLLTLRSPMESIVSGGTFTVKSSSVVTPPIGKTFKEWNTKDDGSGTAYAPGASATMPAENIVLFAIWDDIISSVTYDLNGGSGTAPTETDKAATAEFAAASASGLTAPAGKQFKEWNTAADGSGIKYAAGETVTMPAFALTLYAIWENVAGDGGGGPSGGGNGGGGGISMILIVAVVAIIAVAGFAAYWFLLRKKP